MLEYLKMEAIKPNYYVFIIYSPTFYVARSMENRGHWTARITKGNGRLCAKFTNGFLLGSLDTHFLCVKLESRSHGKGLGSHCAKGPVIAEWEQHFTRHELAFDSVGALRGARGLIVVHVRCLVLSHWV